MGQSETTPLLSPYLLVGDEVYDPSDPTKKCYISRIKVNIATLQNSDGNFVMDYKCELLKPVQDALSKQRRYEFSLVSSYLQQCLKFQITPREDILNWYKNHMKYGFPVFKLSLKHIDLNPMQIQALSVLFGGKLSSLRKLNLSNCQIKAEGCSTIISALKTPNNILRDLNLSYNPLGTKGAALIGSLMETHSSLSHLKIRNCKFEASGTMAILDGMFKNPNLNLVRLDVRENGVGEQHIKKLAEIASKSPSFCFIEIYPPFSADDLKAQKEASLKNNNNKEENNIPNTDKIQKNGEKDLMLPFAINMSNSSISTNSTNSSTDFDAKKQQNRISDSLEINKYQHSEKILPKKVQTVVFHDLDALAAQRKPGKPLPEAPKFMKIKEIVEETPEFETRKENIEETSENQTTIENVDEISEKQTKKTEISLETLEKFIAGQEKQQNNDLEIKMEQQSNNLEINMDHQDNVLEVNMEHQNNDLEINMEQQIPDILEENHQNDENENLEDKNNEMNSKYLVMDLDEEGISQDLNLNPDKQHYSTSNSSSIYISETEIQKNIEFDEIKKEEGLLPELTNSPKNLNKKPENDKNEAFDWLTLEGWVQHGKLMAILSKNLVFVKSNPGSLKPKNLASSAFSPSNLGSTATSWFKRIEKTVTEAISTPNPDKNDKKIEAKSEKLDKKNEKKIEKKLEKNEKNKKINKPGKEILEKNDEEEDWIVLVENGPLKEEEKKEIEQKSQESITEIQENSENSSDGNTTSLKISFDDPNNNALVAQTRIESEDGNNNLLNYEFDIADLASNEIIFDETSVDFDNIETYEKRKSKEDDFDSKFQQRSSKSSKLSKKEEKTSKSPKNPDKEVFKMEENYKFSEEDEENDENEHGMGLLRTFLCSICLEEKIIEEMYILNNCEHKFCVSCMKNYVAMKILNFETDKIHCPECSAAITPQEVQQIVNLDLNLNQNLGKLDSKNQNVDLMQKFEEFSLKKALLQMKNLIWCPNQACGNGFILDQRYSMTENVVFKREIKNHSQLLQENLMEKLRKCIDAHDHLEQQTATGTEESSSSQQQGESGIDLELNKLLAIPPPSAVQCPACGVMICALCKNHAHVGMSCEENRNKQLTETQQKEKEQYEEYKKTHKIVGCPECGSEIHKDSGCNEMTCPKCDTKFCYCCGKKVQKNDGHWSKCWKFDLISVVSPIAFLNEHIATNEYVEKRRLKTKEMKDLEAVQQKQKQELLGRMKKPEK